MYYCINMLHTLRHLYSEEEQIELMESVFDRQLHVHLHVMVMQHKDDENYLCKVSDAPATGNPFVGGSACSTAPGALALIQPGSP